MDNDKVVYIQNGILFRHKKEWNNAICSKINGPRDYHIKWSQKERQIPYDITNVRNLKYDRNESVSETAREWQT